MALTAPIQERSVDPYSNRRFSSILNRMTRIASTGEDVILFPNQSFALTHTNWYEVKITPGICIKDDVLIHVTEDYYINFANNNYYIDPAGTMSEVGYYYIVLQYLYARSLPTPKAWYKVIRDNSAYYTGHEHEYIFLGSARVIWNGGESRYEITTVHYTDDTGLIKRPVTTGNWMRIDGGEL